MSIGIYRGLERFNFFIFMDKHTDISVNLYQLTVRRISGELNLQQHLTKNFRSHKSASFVQSLRNIRITHSVKNTLFDSPVTDRLIRPLEKQVNLSARKRLITIQYYKPQINYSVIDIIDQSYC